MYLNLTEHEIECFEIINSYLPRSVLDSDSVACQDYSRQLVQILTGLPRT